LRSDEETRAIILDAARSEFAAGGYAATCMEQVARRASVSTKTLYRLIPNKEALFEAMVTDRIDRFASVVKLRGCEGRDIEAALTEALRVCGELILDGEVIAMQRMIIADSERSPGVAETFYDKAIRRTEETFAGWLRAQARRGLLDLADLDAAAVAGMLLGMLAFQPQRAVMFGRRPPPSRQEIEARAKACALLFLEGTAVDARGPKPET
ncbi:TetR/AcrR family transcriptional regulator, partial [Bradyrhizobium sp.]|uniref:TetR/AcrR family transcriptional regulator n=1 Tax=Bradyrhizobium sp. TaxID=376 RepID=UPI003C31EFA9